MRNIKTLLATLLLTAGLIGGAQATLLEGKTVNVQYFYPDLSSPYEVETNGDYVVGSTVEIPNFYFGLASLDISDTQLTLHFLASSYFFTQPFNGFELSVAPGSVDDFVSVTIDALSNWLSFDSSRISIDDDSILINMQGLDFDSSLSLVLNINTSQQAIPEPATLTLLALAMFGVTAMRRKI